MRQGRTQVLRIGYFPSAGAAWIADLVTYLENTHPGVTATLESTDGAFSPEGPDLQLVVSRRTSLDVPAAMDSELLLTDPHVAALPVRRRRADLRPRPTADDPCRVVSRGARS